MEAASPSTTVRTLIVSRPKEGRIGTLTFESGNRVTLITEGSGPAVDELQKAWSEMSAMPKLKWVRSEVKEIDGRKVTQIRSREYAREEAAYFYAVLDTLSRRYGFRADIAK